MHFCISMYGKNCYYIIDLFILAVYMQATCCDTIIKCDVNIRSTFFTFGGGVNYRSHWQASHASPVYHISFLNDFHVKIQLLAFRKNFVTPMCNIGVRRWCQQAENFIWFLQNCHCTPALSQDTRLIQRKGFVDMVLPTLTQRSINDHAVYRCCAHENSKKWCRRGYINFHRRLSQLSNNSGFVSKYTKYVGLPPRVYRWANG